MALHRLSSRPHSALHSSNGPGSKGHHAPMRDITAWLALGLSIAAIMFVVARASTDTPRASTTPTTTLAGRGLSSGSSSRTTSSTLVSSHPRSVVRPRPSSTTATKTTLASLTPATPTTLVHATSPAIATSTRPDTALVSEQWAGALTYPNDVATSYSFTTTGGTVIVRTTLDRGATRLTSSLQCADSPALRTSHTAETTMKASAGSCTYNLQFVDEAFQAGARASYQITAEYPGAVPAP